MTRMDNHFRAIGSRNRFNKDPDVFNNMQWEGAQASNKVDLMLFPAAGPLGKPLAQNTKDASPSPPTDPSEAPTPSVGALLQAGWGGPAEPNPSFPLTSSPTYNRLARIITGLPRWTHIPKLLREAGLPPMEALLDNHSRQYGMRILLSDDTHPCKKRLLTILASPQPDTTRCGLTRIGKLLQDVLPCGRLEDTTTYTGGYLPQPDIRTDKKESEGKKHQERIETL